MCGIFAVIKRTQGGEIDLCKFGKKYRNLRELAYTLSGRQRHRGPDHTGVVDIPEDGVVFVQERLSIVCVETGDQPFQSSSGNLILAGNGEIYNYLDIARDISSRQGRQYTARSDFDVIIALYEEFGENLLQYITGMFAFVMYDKVTKEILIARDPIGIIPLYKGEDANGNLWLASEMKCLVGVCEKIEVFPPGHSMFGRIDNLQAVQYYQPKWISDVPTSPVNLSTLEQQLVESVRSHLMCDKSVPFGALLSGGVDSSLIASIITKIMREKDPNFRLKTYSVGLKNAPDFKYSKIVADFIGSEHKEIIFNVDDAMDTIRDVIYHIETYDVTTVRCSTPMILLARAIKSEGLKMILSGEGADEIFGGYLYFFNAPNKEEFHQELVNRVLALSFSDCLRANKSTMTYGLELRVPFLDTPFINHAMQIRPEDKMPGVRDTGTVNGHVENGPHINGSLQNGHTTEPSVPNGQSQPGRGRIEKHILRAAFAKNYLPDEVLWRQKEQFSDGVGYSWIDTIRMTATAQVSDQMFSEAARLFPINTPTTKEAFYYRSIFNELFPGDSYANTVQRWVPRLDWGCSEDPSGRAQKTHTSAY